MKFTIGQRIEYRTGEKGTILTTERNNPKYPVVSITDDGDIWTHTLSGKVNRINDNPYDIMPPAPQGKDLVGYLCGVSDKSLEEAQKHAKDRKHAPRFIKDYEDTCFPYKDSFSNTSRFAWPVSKRDLEGHLWEGNDEIE